MSVTVASFGRSTTPVSAISASALCLLFWCAAGRATGAAVAAVVVSMPFFRAMVLLLSPLRPIIFRTIFVVTSVVVVAVVVCAVAHLMPFVPIAEHKAVHPSLAVVAVAAVVVVVGWITLVPTIESEAIHPSLAILIAATTVSVIGWAIDMPGYVLVWITQHIRFSSRVRSSGWIFYHKCR